MNRLQPLVDKGIITIHGDVIKLTLKSWRIMTNQSALHFVGFKDDRWWNAVKTFGKPDFIHRFWDARAVCEICEGDKVVFANGDENQVVNQYAYDDSAYF